MKKWTKPRVIRRGSDFDRFVGIAGQATTAFLKNGAVTFDNRDAAYLADLLNAILSDTDVRERFFVAQRGASAKVERDFWITQDRQRLRSEGYKGDRLADCLMARWGVDTEAMKRIHKHQVMAPPLPLVVIERYRALVRGKK